MCAYHHRKVKIWRVRHDPPSFSRAPLECDIWAPPLATPHYGPFIPGARYPPLPLFAALQGEIQNEDDASRPPPRPALKEAKRKVRACTFFSPPRSPRKIFSLFLAKVPANCKRGKGKEEKGGRWALRTYVCAISPPLNFFFFQCHALEEANGAIHALPRNSGGEL